MTSVMSTFARTIFQNKYAHQINGRKEEWAETAKRVAQSVVRPYLPHLADRIERLIADRKFLPAGRYLYATGKRTPQIANCFLFRAEDTREGWGNLMDKCTNALMTGGGIGISYSKLRAEGSIIAGMGGKSTGPMALMKMVNEAGRYIVQGGSRRSAIWAGLHWWHPDIFKFIEAKDWSQTIKDLKDKDFNFPAPLDGTNISVILDDDFFEAYHDSSNDRSDHARDVYWCAVRSMLKHGEPGFSVDVGENSGEELRNACLTGDTVVATADGLRGAKIKDLVGKETKVYAADHRGQVIVTTLKNVRVTRRNARIIKVTFDDGSDVRLTHDHQIMLASGVFVEAEDLTTGTRVMPFGSEVRQLYRRVRCKGRWIKQCLMVTGRGHHPKDGCDVHHVNEDHLDDRPENLQVLTHAEHAAVKMKGDQNPSARIGQDLAWRVRKSIAATGKRNAAYRHGRRQKSTALSKLHDVELPERDEEKECGFCGSVFRGRGTTRTCSKSCGMRLGLLEGRSYASGRTVIEVEEDGVEDVYDGSCPGTECFAIITSGDHTDKTAALSGIVVHNCTEITSRDDSDMCNLGSLNLARINSLEEFHEGVELGIAFLLCGTIYGKLPLDTMYKVREKNRRIGLGLMGVHEWLLRRGYQYGPCAELEKWMEVYIMSGAFANRYADGLSVSRPVATRSVAPTGTISIVAETTSGIEPVLATAYKRRYLNGQDWMAQYVVDPTAHRIITEHGVAPRSIEDSMTLADDVERRMQFQAWLQKYVDHGISSTINLPPWGSELNNEGRVTRFGNTLLKYLPEVRGVTAYPDGSRGGQPLVPVPYEDAISQLGVEFVDGSEGSCKNGLCGS